MCLIQHSHQRSKAVSSSLFFRRRTWDSEISDFRATQPGSSRTMCQAGVVSELCSTRLSLFLEAADGPSCSHCQIASRKVTGTLKTDHILWLLNPPLF